MILKHKNITIEILDDSSFTLNSNDNTKTYNHTYADKESEEYSPSSKHSVTIRNGDNEIISSILCASGGATCIHNNSAIFDDECIYICVANKIFCLTLRNLELKWIIEPDWACCFGIYKTPHGYIIHGEGGIHSIDNLGKVNWSFGGRDIFVTQDGKEAIKLNKEDIEVTDWIGCTYRINYKGIEI